MDFRSVATKLVDDIQRPPLPPAGMYVFQITKLPKIDTTKDGKWDIVEYQVRGVGAHADVDEEELQKYGGAGKILSRVAFLFNKEDETEFKRAEYNHKRFLEEHVKCVNGGEQIMEAMNNSVNQQFLGEIKWTPDKNDPEVFHANIGRTAPVA
jgi:hypothetical protein